MSNLCPTCGVAWDHHGSACNLDYSVTNFPQPIGEHGPEYVTIPPLVTFGEIKITVKDNTIAGTRFVGVPFCPDLLRIEDMGEADNLRGHLVRGFFHALAAVDRWL